MEVLVASKLCAKSSAFFFAGVDGDVDRMWMYVGGARNDCCGLYVTTLYRPAIPYAATWVERPGSGASRRFAVVGFALLCFAFAFVRFPPLWCGWAGCGLVCFFSF